MHRVDFIGQTSFYWGLGYCVRIGLNGRAGAGEGGRFQGGSSDRGVCVREQHAQGTAGSGQARCEWRSGEHRRPSIPAAGQR